MSGVTITEVLPTGDARARLGAIARAFDELGISAQPVVFGSHRRAQGVIVPIALWERIAPAVEDALDIEEATDREARSGGRTVTLTEVEATLGRTPA